MTWTPETAPLTPMPLGVLLDRVAHEWSTRKRIFDLPTARFWKPDPEIDLSFEFLGRKAATPVGPAAGPHSQLAQNIVLSWLGGSRLIELKTVQIIDDLDIARPCIDMQTVGYNIEWSQELSIEDSLVEYAKAAMMIEILSRWEPLKPFIGDDPGPCVFDMSVGYDLAGISSPKVAGFISGMVDASEVIEGLRSEIPDGFAEARTYDFASCISDTITLSTFHGCPPDEIEAITKHLLDEHGVDVIVKLNPTLLGYETVRSIVNDQLGYADVDVKEQAFADDLQFGRGIELIGELYEYAIARDHTFGIKLTNTLVVNNHKGFMPDETMYLSGAPLHVLAMKLLAELASALPNMLAIPGHDGPIMVSFSAGISKENLAEAIGTGVNPATVCSDLLKPGGYGRLAPMLKALTKTIRESDATTLGSWRAHRLAEAIEAGHATPAAHHAAAILSPEGIDPYHFESNSKLPRAVDNELQMFGCVACNFCVTVCPNDAFFAVKSLEGQDDRQQYLVLAELCNECGNCLTFCPETGDPAELKPRLFRDPDVFAARSGQGFLVADDGSVIDHRVDDEAQKIVASLLQQDAGLPLGPKLRRSTQSNSVRARSERQ